MDRRQRKTRQAIYAAFEGLMAEQHYSEVTVAQVIKRADIGRSTFYAHFETKDELLNQMCVEMFTHIFEGVDEHCVTHATLEAKDLTGMLAHLLYHLRDTHHGICGKLLGEGEPHSLPTLSCAWPTCSHARCPNAPICPLNWQPSYWLLRSARKSPGG